MSSAAVVRPYPVAVPEPSTNYKEIFMTLVFSYLNRVPPDDLTRELAYRMLRQKITFLRVVEYGKYVYVVMLQKGNVLMFRLLPPDREDENLKFRGWKYKTIRNVREMPVEVLRAALAPFISLN